MVNSSLPHPSLPLDQILTGDCLEVLAALPEKSVDLVFADPPYNLQLQQELFRPNHTLVDAVTDDWDQFASFSEYDAFCREWLAGCRRVLKDTGTLWVIGSYHNIYRIGAIMQDMGFWILNDIAWIKTNPMPNFRGVRFTNAHETLIWASKYKGAQYTFDHHAMKAVNDDLQMRSDWVLPICSGPERIRSNGKKAHSTQKPEALLYRVILSSTRPGAVVLDPFFGSGTTGAAARKLGRHWIGIEREEKYVQVAAQRIAAVTPAPPEALALPQSKRRQRLPFGNLVESGQLQPGQQLFFDRDLQRAATILVNGHLDLNGVSGSIHQVAALLLGSQPANGWERWYFQDEQGEIRAIDELREAWRKEEEIRQKDGEGLE